MKACKLVYVGLLVLFALSLVVNFVPISSVKAETYTTPSTPHDCKVLIVADGSWDGQLALQGFVKYGYNVTYVSAYTIDYTTDPRTSDLSQYDVVAVLGGNTAFNPTKMTEAEVIHFMDYDGVLIWHFAGFRNETAGNAWWSSWDVSPVTNMEARLGLLWSYNPASTPANATLTLQNSSFTGAPAYINQIEWTGQSAYYQGASGRPSTNGATLVYDLSSLSGAVGVTWYKNATGAIGIFLNSWVFFTVTGSEPWTYSYKVMYNADQRSELLHSLISYSLQKDPCTIIKPQPLAIFRLDDFPVCAGATDTLATNALTYSQAIAEELEIPISYAVLTHYSSTYPNFWNLYRELQYSEFFEGSVHVNHTDYTAYSQAQCEDLLTSQQTDFDNLNIERFSTFIVPVGTPAYNTENMRLACNAVGIPNMDLTTTNGSIVEDGTLYHGTINLGGYSNFTDQSKYKILYNYYYIIRRQCLQWLAEGSYASVYNHENSFWYDECGTEQARNYQSNLTADVPTVKFVTLYEAVLHYGNKWMQISSATRSGNTVSFTVTAPNPAIGGIGKGMLWIYVGNSTQKIASVTVDGEGWYCYDDYSIRIPASDCSVVVTLGTEASTAHISEADRQITATSYSDEFTFTVSSFTGTRSQTQVYCGSLGEPSSVNGATSYSYNSGTQTLTVSVTHASTQEVTLTWAIPSTLVTTIRNNYYVAFTLIGLVPTALCITLILGILKARETMSAEDMAALLGLIATIIISFIIVIAVMNAMIGA